MAFARAENFSTIGGYAPDDRARADNYSLLTGYLSDNRARLLAFSCLVGYIPRGPTIRNSTIEAKTQNEPGRLVDSSKIELPFNINPIVK